MGVGAAGLCSAHPGAITSARSRLNEQALVAADPISQIMGRASQHCTYRACSVRSSKVAVPFRVGFVNERAPIHEFAKSLTPPARLSTNRRSPPNHLQGLCADASRARRGGGECRRQLPPVHETPA